MKFNFKNDWKEHVESELKSFGFSYDEDKDISANSFILFNIQRRLPTITSRKVIFSKEFVCPNENLKGLKSLVNKFESSECLKANLSKTILKAGYNDATLDDWGIHHFHLGEREINGVIERTKNVVFVLAFNNCALFIQVLPHGKGHSDVWVNESLIDIIHRNWPDSIAHMKSPYNGSILSTEERKNLRKKCVNSEIQVSDGTAYFSPGGGRMSNGVSFSDFTKLQFVFRELDYFEALVDKEKEQISSKIVSPSGELHLRVDFSDKNKINVYEVNTKSMLVLNEE